ncbi:hypothetical protein FACS1894201_00220 [Bacteroidia bacterium]|nr:hypothetical protein FACS1894201_00220 [Bacteroidia bacterium]
MKKIVLTMFTAAFAVSLMAQDITLPQPQKNGGKPLMEALNNRKTERSYSAKELSLQQLSNLLWAASGINREDGRMTAPTASNNQQIIIFVGLKDAVYQYLPKENKLKLQVSGDHRKVFCRQSIAATAPVVLALVSNYDKMGKYDDNTKFKYSCTDAGNVSQNIYLYSASEGLGTVAIGNFDADELSKTLKLTPNFHPILNQLVGFLK